MAVAESMGCSEVYRVSRDGKENCITYAEALEKHSDARVIINTTPVGMYPNIGRSPINLDDYPKVNAVVDAVYNPLSSMIVCDAKRNKIKATGGLYMLVAQAAFAAELFLNTKVDRSEIDRVFNELVALKQNIVLVGMPGCGKTTIGKLLAKVTGKTFIDTDEEIVKRENKPIPRIFAEVGEKGFRKIESQVIFDISTVQNSIIATGGGAVLDPFNVEMLRENGKIYFIDRELDSIAATGDRPLSSNRADLEKRYKERYPIYSSICDFHLKASNDAHENAEEIKKAFYHENTCN